MSNINLKEIFNEIKKADNILLLSHQKPDGDAIGSMLALKMIIENVGINVEGVVTDLPEFAKDMPGNENLFLDTDKEYDLTIILDLSSLKQIGIHENLFNNSKNIIIIDHHMMEVSNDIFHYIEPSFSSTTMIIYEFIKENNIEINESIAENLYIGLITDTAGFSNRNTNKETFKMSSELLNYGIDHNKIYKNHINPDYIVDYLMIEKEVIENLKIIDENIAFSYLSNDVVNKYSYETPKEFVNLGKNILGIEVSILIIEEEKGIYRVSIRSKNYLDVSQIAKKFGGGGHKYASGIRFKGNYEEIKEKIIAEIKNALKENK